MERIRITEQDSTQNGTTLGSTEVVYIPGFAIGGTAAPRQPKLCTTVQAFVSYFGNKPAQFWSTQYYPLASASNNTGFSALAIPSESETKSECVWFPGAEPTESYAQTHSVNDITFGASDPNYIYAIELLTAGIAVVYERLNNVVQYPVDDDGNYFFEFKPFTTYALNDMVIYKDKYYRCINADNGNKAAFEPSDWTIDCGAPVYTTTKEFIAGDICFHDGTYYKAKSATSGAWSSSKWDAIETPAQVKPYDVTVDTFYNNVIGGQDLPEDTYAVFDAANSSLLDRGELSIKYLTTGAMPNWEYGYTINGVTTWLADAMARVAYTRGDAIALIDCTDNPARPLLASNTSSVYYNMSNVSSIGSTYGSFATMVYPWGTYKLSASYINETTAAMPGSFGYLLALAKTLQNNPAWYAISGASRGRVPSLKELRTNKTLTNSIADSYQVDPTLPGISINPITRIANYGYCIWGNRTLTDNATNPGFATIFTNTRNLICDIKKRCFLAAQSNMFEPNSDILWTNFKSMIAKLLNEMQTSNCISSYQIIKNSPVDKTKLSCTVKIVPQYSVESFDIFINLTDTDEIEVEE